jgi:serine/threonine-protein kinase
METLQRIVRNAPVIPPCAADPHYPPALERVVMRALAHKREDRFDSAAEMLYELSAAMELAHEMEVGAFVQDVCERSLRDRRAQIAAALELAAARDEGAATPALFASVAPPYASAPPSAELSILQHGSTNAPAATDLLLPQALPAKPGARRWALPALLLGAALGVFAFQARLPALPVLGEAPSPAAQGLPVAPPASRAMPRPPAAEPSTASDARAAAPNEASREASAADAKSAPATTKKARRSNRCRPGSPCPAVRVAPTKGAAAPAAKPAPTTESVVDHYGI